ncbi:MAG TPA: CDP-glucose 4,6-dehydratase [Chthoniobacteraceae bacterium]|nr:CDP-glucose 4,6-dehydratase [Chthoniobacteraceae bacterium]
MFSGAYEGKVVWLSGHTGFKGAWLAAWLLRLGARVHGFSLPPDEPSLFNRLGLEPRLKHEIGDVRDLEAVKESITGAEPDFVFHLAAQALVRRSYEEPLETYETNAMGTAHVLEALRSLGKPCGAVFVTTDKCYENRETDYAYVEEDHLGGHDPYSSSKAAAEIMISAYRRSFFGKSPVRIASARAGNVIGGGDWALDRIVPDCIRHLQKGEAIPVRNPSATRPWQHVLEPLSAYLWLGSQLREGRTDVCTAFNFGPEKEANRPVIDLVGAVLKTWPGKWEDKSDPRAVHEAKLLMLSTAKAKRILHWKPAWDFEKAVGNAVGWYRTVHQDPGAAEGITLAQIGEYERDASSTGIAWASNH